MSHKITRTINHKVIIGKPLVFYSLVVFSFLSCAPSRIVRPLGKNEQVVGVSIGGPLIKFSGLTIPMPLSSLQYGRGITEKTTAFASLHTTSLLYGVFQSDVGICTHLYRSSNQRFGVSANPVLNFAVDRWERQAKLWPQVDFNTYYELKAGKTFVYAGFSNWFELSKYRAHDELQQNHWLLNPHLGINYVKSRWNFILESKYLAPAANTTPNVVEYTGIHDKGALGIYIGVNYFLR